MRTASESDLRIDIPYPDRKETVKMNRTAEVNRTTKETDIQMKLSLDGTGASSIDTGIGFFDHMLEGFSKHGFFDLDVKVKGDLQVDTILWRMSALYSGRQLPRQSERRRESEDTDSLFSPWTTPWLCVRLIYAEDRI